MRGFSRFNPVQPTVLTVPGLGGSGPAHWQTLWEQARPNTLRVDLGMWNTPHRNTWVTKLDQAIRAVEAPVILAAHSLGCLAVAWWAELTRQPYGWPVAGALLVAPADVERRDAPGELTAFAPTPKVLLPFPSMVVASRDDPWITIERALSLAIGWGSEFIDIGAQGHLNAASGLGCWSEGQALLDRVVSAAADRHGRPPAHRDARPMLTTSTADAAPPPDLCD